MTTTEVIEGNGIKIEWEILEILDREDHQYTRLASGIGDDGKLYNASALYVCGEFEEMQNIDEC